MRRVYGPHLGMEKMDSFCGFQELFLYLPAPTFCLLLQGPQFLHRWAIATCSFSSLFRCVQSSSCTHRSCERKHGPGAQGPLSLMEYAPVHACSEESSTNLNLSMFPLSWRVWFVSPLLLLNTICWLVGFHDQRHSPPPYYNLKIPWFQSEVGPETWLPLTQLSWSSISLRTPSMFLFSWVASILLLVSESRLDCRESIAHTAVSS